VNTKYSQALKRITGMLVGFVTFYSSSVLANDDAMHDMGDMKMSGAMGDYPMSRDASGTSWQPESTPMQGKHVMAGEWMWMFHGYVDVAYDHQQGARGDTETFAESMFMAMGSRTLGAGMLSLRGMFSVDPLTMPKDGYPLLLQTGETTDGVTPLVDRQHPHDLFMELSGTYSLPLGDGRSAFVYLGLPGEPALGPPAFMHRFSAVDDPEAPLSHHWLDATHITFGVATLGYVQGPWKLEASAFNAHEPDQNRYDIEVRALDSSSLRLSFNPNENWAWQVSRGWMKSPEQLEPGVDVNRTTASVSYNVPTMHGNWQTTLAWGSNDHNPGDTTDAWLFESAWNWSPKNTVFVRAEQVDKGELFEEDHALHDQVFDVRKLSIGMVRDLAHGDYGTLSLGAVASKHFLPDALTTSYGNDPSSYMVFMRWKLD